MECYEPSSCKLKRDQRREFLEKLVPYRDDLFKYCRKLTNNPWDAEDLAQETLANAYTRLSDAHLGIENLKSYLFKMATNQWIDWCRRSKLADRYESENMDEAHAYTMGSIFEVKDHLSLLHYHLPPKERVAIILKDVFEFSLEESAKIMESSEGAVKVALHRGREKMAKLKVTKLTDQETKTNPAHKKLIEQAVHFFNQRDLEGFSSLFLQNATANGFGCFFEEGLEQMKKGSLFYTLNSYDGSPLAPSFTGKVVEIQGENLFAIFKGNTLDDIWRFTFEEGKFSRFDCYYCCPNVLSEIALLLKVEANSHGHYFEQTNS
jgi:RNA polymerase sigma-70 factor, ECF subfamily